METSCCREATPAVAYNFILQSSRPLTGTRATVNANIYAPIKKRRKNHFYSVLIIPKRHEDSTEMIKNKHKHEVEPCKT